MNGIGWIAAILLGVAAGEGANEHILIAGRVRIVQEQSASETASRRFEITVTRKQGKAVSANACVFAELQGDEGWNGSCFPLELYAVNQTLHSVAFKEPDLSSVDQTAQRLLRMLMRDFDESVSGNRHVVGYDQEAPITIHVAKFTEATL